MRIQHVTTTHTTDSHDRGPAPPAVMHNIRRLQQLYQELDEILSSVAPNAPRRS